MAQNDSLLFEAQRLCTEKKFDQAIKIIEKEILLPEAKLDPFAWKLRAFAYTHSYNQSGKNNTSKAYLLDTALRSAIYSISVDKAGDNKEDNNKVIENISKKFHNLCNVLLNDSLNYLKANLYFTKYKKTLMLISPEFNFTEKDIQFYNASGSKFVDLYLNNKSRKEYQDAAKLSLFKVLEIDPKNISANINLGVLFYNEGVELMNKMEYDVDLVQLDVVQENAKKLFKQSLPFMNKVYQLQPKEARALDGLEGIYHALNDYEMENFFKQKKEALNNK